MACTKAWRKEHIHNEAANDFNFAIIGWLPLRSRGDVHETQSLAWRTFSLEMEQNDAHGSLFMSMEMMFGQRDRQSWEVGGGKSSV